jgi:hypothetical protein
MSPHFFLLVINLGGFSLKTSFPTFTFFLSITYILFYLRTLNQFNELNFQKKGECSPVRSITGINLISLQL